MAEFQGKITKLYPYGSTIEGGTDITIDPPATNAPAGHSFRLLTDHPNHSAIFAVLLFAFANDHLVSIVPKSEILPTEPFTHVKAVIVRRQP